MDLRPASALPPPEADPRLRKIEVPFSQDWEPLFESGRDQRPATPMQALMEAPPFCDPEPSLVEGLVRKERVSLAIDALPDRLRWVFEAKFYRSMSVREIGVELNVSKSQAHRLYQQAVVLLQKELEDLV